MLALIGFLLTIGILVIIHEFGHYLFARWFKVKVLTFSLGFGPKLFSWHSKSNRWCVCAIPLGGYVQMLDEREAPVAAEQKHLAFNNKPAYQKLLIAFAGPLFNILFAFGAYYAIGLYGVYSLKPTIISMDPTPLVQNLTQIPAGSTILALNNQKVTSWNEADQAFVATMAQQDNLSLKLSKNQQTFNVTLNLAKLRNNQDNPSLMSMGLYPFSYLPQISYVQPQSPAASAGLREDDKIVQINSTLINNWFTLAHIIRNSPSQKLNFSVVRNGQPRQIMIVPDSATDDNGQIIGKIGIMPTLNQSMIDQNSFIKHYDPLNSLVFAFKSCTTMVSNNLEMLGLMLSGKVSWHNVGGPVTIAKASGAALHLGVKAFVDLLAIISLSLAVMNLLPIPVLDGGHILIYGIEWLRGKPLNINTQQILFKIGLVVVLSITFMALYNDFLKLFNL